MSNDEIRHSETKFRIEEKYRKNRTNFLPWEARLPSVDEESEIYKEILEEAVGAKFLGPNIFISPESHIYTDKFSIEANSFVAAGVIIRGEVRIGSECSINAYSQIAGRVNIGNGVRIANQVSIFGFNHNFSSIEIPIYKQLNTSEGIIIGDDVWVGSNVVVVDGVHIGAHSVVAGGSVVTRNFPQYSIIAGNPARMLKSRLDQN